jgi:hypothetical protein
VHDRHHDRAEERGRVEHVRGLDPVGQLEAHDVARSDASFAQPRRECQRVLSNAAMGRGRRSHRGVHDERLVAVRLQSFVQHRAERVVRPPAVPDPLVRVRFIDMPE